MCLLLFLRLPFLTKTTMSRRVCWDGIVVEHVLPLSQTSEAFLSSVGAPLHFAWCLDSARRERPLNGAEVYPSNVPTLLGPFLHDGQICSKNQLDVQKRKEDLIPRSLCCTVSSDRIGCGSYFSSCISLAFLFPTTCLPTLHLWLSKTLGTKLGRTKMMNHPSPCHCPFTMCISSSSPPPKNKSGKMEN